MEKEEFRSFRIRLKKTQKQLAELLGVSIKAVHSYEQGWRPVPAAVERQLFFLLSRLQTGRKLNADCWNVKKCPQRRRENCPAWEFRSGSSTAPFVMGLCKKTGKTKWPCADPAKSSKNC
jgi:hypothetical protein